MFGVIILLFSKVLSYISDWCNPRTNSSVNKTAFPEKNDLTKSKHILVVIKYLTTDLSRVGSWNKRLFALMETTLSNDLTTLSFVVFFFHQPTLIIINSIKSFEREKQIITVNRKLENPTETETFCWKLCKPQISKKSFDRKISSICPLDCNWTSGTVSITDRDWHAVFRENLRSQTFQL